MQCTYMYMYQAFFLWNWYLLSTFLCVYFICRSIGGEISQDGDFMMFESNRYRAGFLYKTLAMSAIVSSGIVHLYDPAQICHNICMMFGGYNVVLTF